MNHRLGPFAPDTVYRAILYAADGRPMSVTILSSDAFARKVLLHPALEDSRLGCEMIQLDRFTFSYIDADTRGAVNKAIARAQVQNDLYTMSVITGRRATWSPPAPRRCTMERFTRFGASVGGGNRESLRCLPTPRHLRSRASTASTGLPLSALSRGRAGAGSHGVERFQNCMQAQAVEWGGGEVKNWKLAPELTIVSGVRDEPFRMDPDLSFTKAPTGRGDTWPLEFLVQDTAAGERATPWSFPEVAPRLRPAVSRLMFENQDARSIVAGVREFALLQRIFRLGFAGKLGDDFPLAEIAALAAAARSRAQDKVDTVRWVPPATSPAATLRKRLQSLHQSLSETERKEFEVDRRRATTCLNVMTKVEAGGTIPSRFEELCRVGGRDAAARRCRAGTSSAACGLVALTAAMHRMVECYAALGQTGRTAEAGAAGRCATTATLWASQSRMIAKEFVL